MDIFQLENILKYACYNDEQKQEIIKLMEPFINEYKNNVTGDACKGDKVCYVREVWSGSRYRPEFEGFKIEKGIIINDSYGREKQQHTFTILLDNGEKTRIKGRNLYKYVCLAMDREEKEREEALDEKHKRGHDARLLKLKRMGLDII